MGAQGGNEFRNLPLERLSIGMLPENRRNCGEFAQTEKIGSRSGNGAVEIAPVNEGFGNAAAGKSVPAVGSEEVELFLCQRVHLFQQLPVPGLLIVKEKEVREEERVIREDTAAAVRGRFVEDAGRNLTIRVREGGQQIDAPFEEVEVAEGYRVDLRFEPQVAQPEPAVAFRPVQHDLLHAVAEGALGGTVELNFIGVELFLRRQQVADCGLCREINLFDAEFSGGGDHLKIEIPHRVDAGEFVQLGHIIQRDDLLLNPGAGERTLIAPVPFADFDRTFCKDELEPDGGVVEVLRGA